jgi:hypothetical protein
MIDIIFYEMKQGSLQARVAIREERHIQQAKENTVMVVVILLLF